eukprot:7372029-Pyramimonas_sp.AAC.1
MRRCTICAARCAEAEGGRARLERGECIKQRRPIRQPELSGAVAEEKATKTVPDLCIISRSALAYAWIAHA